MISEKQLEANHQNALQSTGPNTAEGVETVKLNALSHVPLHSAYPDTGRLVTDDCIRSS
jgi:hypothetical protein